MLERFGFDVASNGSADLEFDSHTQIPVINQKIKIHPDIYCAPITIGPVVLVPKIGIYAGLKGKVDDSAIDLEQTSDFSAGIYYENGEWNGHENFSTYFNLLSQDFSGESQVKLPVGVQVELLAYDLVGAYVGSDGFARAEINPGENPWWRVFGGLEVLLGAKIQTFGWNLVDYSMPIIEHEELLDEAEDLPVNQLTQLTNGGLDFNPAWSLDGNNLFFDGNDGGKNLYYIPSDGQGPRVFISPFAWDPDISHDGNKIVCTAYREGNADIYSMNLDGSGELNLTEGNEMTDSWPTFSPDGSRVAYVSTKYVNGNITEGPSLYVMDADGSNKVKLSQEGSIDRYPSFSPDGEWIVYQSLHEGEQNHRVRLIKTDGSGERVLTGNAVQYGKPSWFPDGSRILFEKESNGWDLYSINVDGSDERRITNTPGAKEYMPTISHDGSNVAFSIDGNLYKLTLNR